MMHTSRTAAHAASSALVAVLLLVLQLVTPALALDALASPAAPICRADGPQGGGATHAMGCALCPACQAPTPVLPGAAAAPGPRLAGGFGLAVPSPTHASPPAWWPAAQPRGPPAAV